MYVYICVFLAAIFTRPRNCKSLYLTKRTRKAHVCVGHALCELSPTHTHQQKKRERAESISGELRGVLQKREGCSMAAQAPGLEQSSVSLSAQAELELELSLRGSLLVQQQRRIVQLEDELQRAWSEIERLRSKLGTVERERPIGDDDGSRQPRYWTPEEHTLFVEAVQRYGWKDVKAISQHVGTRNPTQVGDQSPLSRTQPPQQSCPPPLRQTCSTQLCCFLCGRSARTHKSCSCVSKRSRQASCLCPTMAVKCHRCQMIQ